MFTGIVEAMGTVRTITETDQGRRIEIETNLEGLQIGDSLSLNGVCLTVIERTSRARRRGV